MRLIGSARVFRIPSRERPNRKAHEDFAMLGEDGWTICTCKTNRRSGTCAHSQALGIYAELAGRDAEKAEKPRKRSRQARARIQPVEPAPGVSGPQASEEVPAAAQG